MEKKTSYYTEAGLKKLLDELHALKTTGRAQIAQQLSDARDKGDLSENAEYDAAKEAQGILEAKIGQLEEVVTHARVLSASDIDTSKVSILSTVKIKNKKLGQTFAYTLVAEEEADLKAGKISVESPIGKGLLGKRVGEEAVIEVPSGEMALEVLDIGLSA